MSLDPTHPPTRITPIGPELGQVVSLFERLSRSTGSSVAHQISSLRSALELGEIEPGSALRELRREEAAIVCKLAVACLDVLGHGLEDPL